MKKILILICLLLIIAVIGAFIFLITLDVDKFRPQIVSQIENAIHKPVELEKIKLGWQSGIALELQGFSILKSGQSSEKLVETQSAKAVLKLAPLLSRQIQVATVYLNAPVIRLVKNPDGTFEGLEPSSQKPGPAQGQAASAPEVAAPLSFLVNEIRVQNGEVFFKDATGKEPMEVHLRKITVEIDNVALDQPIDFKAQAAVCSPVQNLDLRGKLSVSSKDFSALLNGFRAELQLMPMDPHEILKVSPAVAASGIIFPVEGTLGIDADSLRLDEKGLKDAGARVRFDRGKVQLELLKSPMENISVDALVSAVMIKIQKFAANAAGGKIEGQGSVQMTDPSSPEIVFGAKADKLKIEDLVQAPVQAGPQINGALSLVVNGSLKGQTPEQIKQTITAEGTVIVEEGVLKQMNVLREVFQKLSVIPGLVEKLLARLPPNYQEKLKGKDTKLQTIRVPFTVQNGTVRLPQLSASTDSFQMTGAGTYGLSQGDVAGNAMLAIEPELSGAMTRSVEELQYLMSPKKEIQIPLTIGGRVPKVTVMPDLQAVASKLATQKAQEMIGGYLEKALGGKKTATSPDSTAPGTTEPATGGAPSSKKDIFGEILRRGIEGMSSETQTSAAPDKTPQ